MSKANGLHKLLNRSFLTVSLTAISLLPITPLVAGYGDADSTGSYVTLSNFSGNPGVGLKVSGGDYEANETVMVSATENGASVANASSVATATGQFSTTLSLPDNLAQGSVVISATGKTSGLVASNNYYVNPFTPNLKVSASQVTPFSSINVSGTGYAPDETVDLNLAGATTKVATDASGDFTGAAVTSPDVPAASYKLIGAGESSGASATAYEYINGFYASASPSSYYLMPGDTLSFNGNGFAAGETVNVTNATTGAPLSSFKTDSTGAFTAAGGFVIPTSYAGLSEKFVLTGSTSQASTTASVTIGKYYPNVTPSSYYVMPGGSLSFNGSGFLPGETVYIYSGTTKIGSIVASPKGTLVAAGTITIPANAAGTTMSFTLTGQSSQGSGTVSVQVGNYNPQASPSGYYVMPGSNLTFTGSGYAPNETIGVFSGTTSVGSISADDTGAFTSAGNYQIAYDQANTSVNYKLVGSVSNQPINFSIGVGQLNAMISPSSYYVLPYAAFNVSATGFAPNETVNLMNGTTALGTTTTSALGAATFKNISLPSSTLGSDTLTAVGVTSKATATATVGIGSYYPSVVASNYYARPGTPITLNGSGFAPNETVTITAGSLTQKVTADAKGNTTASLILPFGQTKNSLNIVSTGSMSMASSTTTITLAPYMPQVSPSTYYATPGTPVSFTGSGFAPNETIDVSLNGVQVGTETADAKGNLASTGSYTLPFGKIADFTLTGLTSGAIENMNIGLAQFYAGLQLSSYYGNGGSTITATGSGFAPGELIQIQSGTSTLAKASADKNGSFSLPIEIPYSAAGKINITASGSQSGSSASTSYTVAQAYNSVGLGSYAVPAGQAVNITGSGFFAGEPVTVTTNRTTSSYTFNANSLGNLNNSGFVLPANLTPGNLTLTITGTESYTSHQITMYVQPADAQ